jgi:hypothetical protein
MIRKQGQAGLTAAGLMGANSALVEAFGQGAAKIGFIVDQQQPDGVVWLGLHGLSLHYNVFDV